MSIAIETTTITEGSTLLVVPDETEPKKYPAFFNPRGSFVRDVSVACYKAYAATIARQTDELVFADSLSGTGARGIRVANEVSEFKKVLLNDVSPTSMELAKRSADLNRVSEKCYFSNSEVCSFLSAREATSGVRFDAVDVDPFGTPSPFVDCALRSVKDGGLLSVSATDSAVLCGVYPRVTLRKYLGLPLRTDYAHEVGIRLIFGLLAMTAMRFELSIEPLFSHHDMHYFRTYSIVRVGNSGSKENEKEIGYVTHCFKCGERNVISQEDIFFPQKKKKAENLPSNDAVFSPECTTCSNSRLRIGGPLWIGKIQSKEFVDSCAKISDLQVFSPELDNPLYFDLSEISDELGLRTPRILDVIGELKSSGHSASRTRLNPKAVRTDAPLQVIRKVLETLAR